MSTTPTLSQYLMNHLADHPDQEKLVMIMSDLGRIGRHISREVNRAGLVDILGTTGKVNIQDEEVQKLDVLANEKCKEFLRETGNFAAMASEEEDHPVDMGEKGKDAKYVIAFDPLDGSSNIDVNVSVGTIFSVHERLEGVDRTDEKQFLQKGNTQVLAGYVLYGSSTVLVFSFGDGVHEFTLDPESGEFMLSNEKIIIPSGCKYYSINESYIHSMKEKDAKFTEYLKTEKKSGARYIGSLVADFHRTLLKGGFFMYPLLDKKGEGNYKAKLRLNYEAKPMAFLLEQCGGMGLAENENILDLEPKELHERVPLILGGRDIVEEYLNFNSRLN